MIRRIDANLTALGSVFGLVVTGGYLVITGYAEEAWETVSWHAGVALFAALIALVCYVVGHFWLYPSAVQYALYASGGGISAIVSICNAFVWRRLPMEWIGLILMMFYLACLGLMFSLVIYTEAKAELEAKMDHLNGIDF